VCIHVAAAADQIIDEPVARLISRTPARIPPVSQAHPDRAEESFDATFFFTIPTSNTPVGQVPTKLRLEQPDLRLELRVQPPLKAVP
jgi:hypothetical protein